MLLLLMLGASKPLRSLWQTADDHEYSACWRTEFGPDVEFGTCGQIFGRGSGCWLLLHFGSGSLVFVALVFVLLLSDAFALVQDMSHSATVWLESVHDLLSKGERIFPLRMK